MFHNNDRNGQWTVFLAPLHLFHNNDRNGHWNIFLAPLHVFSTQFFPATGHMLFK
jgi:hypothetical protein